MSYRVLAADDAHWRESNQMGVLNTDLGAQLEATTFGARLWRVAPGQASTRHRHIETAELYVLLEGTGRMRVGEDLLTLSPLSSVFVEPDTVRQLFNDTDGDQLWLDSRLAARVGEHARADPRGDEHHLSRRAAGAATRARALTHGSRATIRQRSDPMPSTSSSATSPGATSHGHGVPREITSPGCRVM